MITSADQYEYVTGANVDSDHPHGDLDRIALDWLPMCSRSNKAAIKGEDFAILMEWAMQRINALTSDKTMVSGVMTDFSSSLQSGVTATFSRFLDGENFGGYSTNLYGAFRACSDLCTFFPRKVRFPSALNKDMGSRSSPIEPFPTAVEAVGGMTLNIDGLKQASDFDSTNPPICQADVQAYFDKLGSYIDGFRGFSCCRASVASQWGLLHPDSTEGGVKNLKSVSGSGTVKKWLGNAGVKWGAEKAVATGKSEDTTGECEVVCYPPPGVVVREIVAPHATSVYAICVFHIQFNAYYYTSDSYDNFYVVRTCEMKSAGGGTFQLKTDDMKIASADQTLGLVKQPSGLTWEPGPTGYPDWEGCRAVVNCCVYPVVFFDEHTQF